MSTPSPDLADGQGGHVDTSSGADRPSGQALSPRPRNAFEEQRLASPPQAPSSLVQGRNAFELARSSNQANDRTSDRTHGQTNGQVQNGSQLPAPQASSPVPGRNAFELPRPSSGLTNGQLNGRAYDRTYDRTNDHTNNNRIRPFWTRAPRDSSLASSASRYYRGIEHLRDKYFQRRTYTTAVFTRPALLKRDGRRRSGGVTRRLSVIRVAQQTSAAPPAARPPPWGDTVGYRVADENGGLRSQENAAPVD